MRSRVVVVAVIEENGSTRAEVWGAEGGEAVKLEDLAGATIRRTNPLAVEFADGTTWTLGGVGCGCKVPGPLRGFNPLRVR